MKKLILPLVLALSITACSKNTGENCHWTDNGGNDWDHYPTAQEIQQIKLDCGCEPTFTKHCD